MTKRAEQVDETRQRIVEATAKLHTTVGPANTTISAIAEEAGVTRLTVYSHFPDEAALFAACSMHWRSLHPPPDPSSWRDIADLEGRARKALSLIYGWYSANRDDLFPLRRDLAAMPKAIQDGTQAAANANAESLARGRVGKRLRAAAGHVVNFWTWRSLVIEQGLRDDEAVELGVRFLLAAQA